MRMKEKAMMLKTTKRPISSVSFKKGVALGGYRAGPGWRRKEFPMLVDLVPQIRQLSAEKRKFLLILELLALDLDAC